jgi:hypothetical protein
VRVRIRGTTFETVEEAARWAEVSPATIYSAMRRGRTDTVGLGGGRKSEYETGGGGRRAVSVELNGVRYVSLSEAERRLGLTKGSLSRKRRR